MSKYREAAWAALALALGGSSAAAHHAFSPVYDASQTVSKEGTLTEFRLINPHVMMTLETTDDAGKPATWTIETVGRLNLVAAGWTEGSLKPGDRVTIFGNPTHTDSTRMYARRVVKADGTALVLSSRSEGFDAIDAARRERASSPPQPAEQLPK